jgi:hypothetical protein
MGTGAGVYGYGTKWKLESWAVHNSIPVENGDKNYGNRNIYILSASQAAIKAFRNQWITSKLVWDCH